uniref:Uncharacterized protein n=1 Tax=Lepeophtheirus salmonis TaxID=72036 RepID=A0A0K2VDQ4_LEPSM
MKIWGLKATHLFFHSVLCCHGLREESLGHTSHSTCRVGCFSSFYTSFAHGSSLLLLLSKWIFTTSIFWWNRSFTFVFTLFVCDPSRDLVG